MDSITFLPVEKFILAGLTAAAVGSFSFEVYRRAGDSCKEIFIQSDEDNLKKILLIGSSELTEIAVLRSHEFKLDIVGIYHPTSTSEKFVNIPIIKESDQLPEYDVAVISELSNIDQTIEDAYKACLLYTSPSPRDS